MMLPLKVNNCVGKCMVWRSGCTKQWQRV